MNTSHFENVVAKCIYKDQKYLARVIDMCDPDFFQNGDIKVFVKKVFDFYRNRLAVPNNTELDVLCDESEIKSIQKVRQIIDSIDDNYNEDELMANTEMFFRERAVYNALVKVTDNMADANPKTKKMTQADILDVFTKACSISVIVDNGIDFIDDIKDFINDLTVCRGYISSGFDFLDKKLNGGWQEGGRAIYVCVGGTNVGKSIMLGQFATTAFLAGKTVVLISLEMSEMMYMSRLVANITKFDINTLPNYSVAIENKVSMLKSQGAGKLIVKEFPTKSTSVIKLSSYLEQLKRSGINPDLIVVDYLNLMTSGKSNDGTYNEVKDIIEQLRSLTYKFDCPIVTATQMNRSGFNKEDPGMEVVSESVGTAFTADAMFSIWATDDDKKMGIIHMGMQKNRFGPNSGTCALKVDYPTMTIEEIDSEVVEEAMSETVVKKSVAEELEDFF